MDSATMFRFSSRVSPARLHGGGFGNARQTAQRGRNRACIGNRRRADAKLAATRRARFRAGFLRRGLEEKSYHHIGALARRQM